MYDQAGQLRYAVQTGGPNPAVTTKYIYLNRHVLAEVANGVVQYGHTDALGSPVARTNAAGVLFSRTRYEPYGITAAGTNPDGIGFTGHVNDVNTGLVQMQQRYYDPVAGRFLSIDPVVTNAKTGSGFNRYVYANNNPFRYVDPDGRESCPGHSANRCIMADTFDPKKSNGQTTVATPEVAKTMVKNKSVVAVTDPGGKEKMSFVNKSGGSLSVKLAGDAVPTEGINREGASSTQPATAVAVLHGHVDGRMNLVSPADAQPLTLANPLPNGVVSDGRVGVTEIVGGRLQFRMLEGLMETKERRDQQEMINSQQEQFQ